MISTAQVGALEASFASFEASKLIHSFGAPTSTGNPDEWGQDGPGPDCVLQIVSGTPGLCTERLGIVLALFPKTLS